MTIRHTFENNPTIFGKILRGELPSTKVYEDDDILAFKNIYPNVATHILIIPKQHIEGLHAATPDDEKILGKLMVVALHVAEKLGVKESGFRLATNAGPASCQSVPHLHLHLIAPEPGSDDKMSETDWPK